MTQQNHQSPQPPLVLGGARNAPNGPLEASRRQQQVRQWQDQQASNLRRQAGKARAKNVAVLALGSALILAFLWAQAQAGRIDPPALILVPTVLALVLVVLAAILPPWREVAQALRQHKRNRKAEDASARR